MKHRTLKPFFSYYGAKHRASKHLPPPKHGHIVEAFAGSAGYACQHPQHAVTLVEINPRIAALWRYLVAVSPEEVLALPDVHEHVDELAVIPEVKTLIGFWLCESIVAPYKRPSAFMRTGARATSFWGPCIRARIAVQVDAIRHWTIVEGSYADFGNDIPPATTIVDPPYSSSAGRKYIHHRVDFEHLTGWCLNRSGTVYVHEQADATWLPFKPKPWQHATTRNASRSASRGNNSGKINHEALCIIEDGVVF